MTRLPPALRDQRGVALLMVLWIFMVLTVLVGEFSRSMRDDAVATQNLAEENQARGVAVAGINRALYAALRAREQNPQDSDDSDDEDADVDELAPHELQPDGSWHEGAYGGGTYAVRIIDEGGKIALNRADESLLRRVFANLGLDTDEQEEVVDAILDWRDPDSLRRLHGAEADYYLGLPEPYVPKDGPFDSVEELLAVRGITRELFFGVPDKGLERDAKAPIPLKEIFSVFNRSANISVRNAPAAVLRLLLNGEEEDVEEVLDARSNDPASALSLMRGKVADPLLARRLVSTAARTVTIDARALMQDGHVEARVGAVVDLAEDGEGFHVARWIDRLPAL